MITMHEPTRANCTMRYTGFGKVRAYGLREAPHGRNHFVVDEINGVAHATHRGDPSVAEKPVNPSASECGTVDSKDDARKDPVGQHSGLKGQKQHGPAGERDQVPVQLSR